MHFTVSSLIFDTRIAADAFGYSYFGSSVRRTHDVRTEAKPAD